MRGRLEGPLCVDSKTWATCTFGYSIGGTCAVACVGAGICAIESAPNPGCVEKSALNCDGASVIRCEDGFVTDRIACAQPAGDCVVDVEDFHRAYCAGAATCAGPNATSCSDGGVIEGCIAGKSVGMMCNRGTSCLQTFITPDGTQENECLPN
jgi:hypothetical protein